MVQAQALQGDDGLGLDGLQRADVVLESGVQHRFAVPRGVVPRRSAGADPDVIAQFSHVRQEPVPSYSDAVDVALMRIHQRSPRDDFPGVASPDAIGGTFGEDVGCGVGPDGDVIDDGLGSEVEPVEGVGVHEAHVFEPVDVGSRVAPLSVCSHSHLVSDGQEDSNNENPDFVLLYEHRGIAACRQGRRR